MIGISGHGIQSEVLAQQRGEMSIKPKQGQGSDIDVRPRVRTPDRRVVETFGGTPSATRLAFPSLPSRHRESRNWSLLQVVS